MTFQLAEGTVVTVAYERPGGTTEITCVVTGVLDRVVQMLPVTPASAPTVDTLIDVVLGSKRFRATVQDSSNDLFTVLRPVDVESVSSSSVSSVAS